MDHNAHGSKVAVANDRKMSRSPPAMERRKSIVTHRNVRDSDQDGRLVDNHM